MPYNQVLRAYWPDGEWVVAEGESGWNNTTRFVEADGRKWVLRIYETHRDPDKIRFEHETLLALSRQALPFRVPVPSRTTEGSTFVRLEDGSGRYACLFAFVDGARPNGLDPQTARAIGEATGRLSIALREIRPDIAPAYAPYYELDAAHPSCPPERVDAFCANPPDALAEWRDELAGLNAQLRHLRSLLPTFKTLPHQLIHGDVNDSNLLREPADPTRLAAILDFEFCTCDVRAMEPAVVLSGMLGEGGSQEAMSAFLKGYGSVVKLSTAEAEAIVPLIRLRKLDVFVHFLGRYLDGVDGPDVLRERIPEAVAGLDKLSREAEGIRSLCLTCLV
ncbi:phosphotransferase [Cohnella nanjingensis]|uniref:Phosphotransferase n=1 Tax=Cohnella nanjingensis TaxID=1387779 RepID=A0A7X0VD37_9BACL|nr:phosphotransferase [Cohnella nanjingensis]MBB6669281.1 phosphotransferase [Cohnella nanjingensis]